MASSQQPTRQLLLTLYRKILKNAKVFPSIRRDRMIIEIKEEWRANATETDPVKIKQHHENAMRGLSQLQAYTGLVDTDTNWAVTMEQTPLGGLSEEKVEAKLRAKTPPGAVPPPPSSKGNQ